jgi:hypothetical protein
MTTPSSVLDVVILRPSQPSEGRPYTNREAVYFGCVCLGMVAQLDDQWIVSTHSDDPRFSTKEEAIRYLSKSL